MPKSQWAQRYTESWASLPRPIRRTLAASVGMVTLITGVALTVLPGPGLVVMLLGLGILATEFTWAQRSIHHVKHHGDRVKRGILRKKNPDTNQNVKVLDDKALDTKDER